MQALGIDVLFKGINMQRLLGGLWISLRISLIAVAFSIVLGLIVGVLMAGDNPVIKAVTRIYLEIVRVMPQMVLLFIVFFGTTRVFGWNIEAEIASIIVFTFWGTAEMADLVRGALISIPKHQYESAAALGMEEGQIYRHIIIPQTLRRLHQSGHPNDQDHESRDDDRRSGGAQGGSADHRGKPQIFAERGVWGVRVCLCAVFCRMLADQHVL